MRLPEYTKRGFTLIELMIAIAVVGMVSIIVYQLFDVTSTNFREVDQLSDTNDRVRFAIERVRTDIQGAGAQSTPDSAPDAWVQPPPTGSIRIAGLVPYDGWQNDQTVMDADVRARNPNVSFDGIVVVGAYDFPLAFELSGLEDAGGGGREGVIEAHYKGIWRLLTQDPFMTGLQNFEVLNANHLKGLGQGTNFASRLLRVTDRQGFMQFMHPESINGPFPGTDFDTATIQLPPDGGGLAPKFKTVGADNWFGLDDLNEGDVAYDAALLDAFWIHAAPDPSNPKVLNLVRDRLCARDVATDAFTAGWDPAGALADQCSPGYTERTVIASNLADFQIWFDCATAGVTGIQNAAWSYKWDDPLNEGACMDSAAPTPGSVRGAHVRLAIHTKSERKDQPHVQFEDATGAVCDPDAPGACGDIDANVLRTYDFYPDSRGAARVVVMQSDFEVVNFANHNL